MAQDPYQVACERYENMIFGDCFRYKVPLWLQHVQDHTIFPSSELRARGGFQWMKVSRFEEFVKACKAFAVDHQGPNSILRVLVMPYMPPRDASMLEDLLIELPPIDGDHEEAMDIAVPQDPEGGEGEEEGVGPWDMRTGNASFEDLGLNVEVVVMNYGLLRSKASLYNMELLHFNGMLSQIEEFGKDFETFFQPFPDGHVDALIAAAKQAGVNLVFAMVDEEKDPHNAILEVYPEMHDRIYEDTCVHCNKAIDYADELDPPETLERLKVELDGLGFEQHAVGSLTVQQAQLEVMATLGKLEHYNAVSPMNAVRDAHRRFVKEAQKAVIDLTTALSWLSILGVNDGESNDEESSDEALDD